MLVNCPAYYSVSAPKAELLNKIKDMPEEVNEEEEQVDVNEKKVKEELRPVSCSLQKESQGPSKDTGSLGQERKKGLSHHQPCPYGPWTPDSHGTLSDFLIAFLSFSSLQMTKVKVITGNKLLPKSLIAETKTQVAYLHLVQHREPSSLL